VSRIPCRRRAPRFSLRRQVTSAAVLSLRPTVRSSRRRIPVPLSDHRHRLWVDRFNDRVRRHRQEAVNQVRTGDRLRLGTAVAFEFGQDPSESQERPIVTEREPHHVLYASRRVWLWRVFFRLQPAPPVPGRGLANIGDGRAPNFAGGGVSQRIMISSRSPSAVRTTGAG